MEKNFFKIRMSRENLTPLTPSPSKLGEGERKTA
jgi:hypothetical protein